MPDQTILPTATRSRDSQFALDLASQRAKAVRKHPIVYAGGSRVASHTNPQPLHKLRSISFQGEEKKNEVIFFPIGNPEKKKQLTLVTSCTLEKRFTYIGEVYNVFKNSCENTLWGSGARAAQGVNTQGRRRITALMTSAQLLRQRPAGPSGVQFGHVLLTLHTDARSEHFLTARSGINFFIPSLSFAVLAVSPTHGCHTRRTQGGRL